MADDILFALWFFLPAGIANLVPVFAARIPLLRQWNYPLDGYARLHGVRVLGAHKTVRGFVTGVLAAILAAAAFSDLVPLEYNPLLLGGLLGAGGLAGDAVKSFFKRRRNIPEGGTWFPFDQLDYIVGGILASALYIPLSVTHYIWICVIWFLMHLLVSWVGYLLGIKPRPL